LIIKTCFFEITTSSYSNTYPPFFISVALGITHRNLPSHQSSVILYIIICFFSKSPFLSTVIDAIAVAIVLGRGGSSRLVPDGGVLGGGIAVTRLLLGVIGGVGVIVAVDGRSLGGVALAGVVELLRGGVRGEGVLLGAGPLGAAAEDAVEEAAGAVASGVVVVGAGTEALLLVVVAGEGDLGQDG
jgi:hypothetical protein